MGVIEVTFGAICTFKVFLEYQGILGACITSSVVMAGIIFGLKGATQNPNPHPEDDTPRTNLLYRKIKEDYFSSLFCSVLLPFALVLTCLHVPVRTPQSVGDYNVFLCCVAMCSATTAFSSCAAALERQPGARPKLCSQQSSGDQSVRCSPLHTRPPSQIARILSVLTLTAVIGYTGYVLHLAYVSCALLLLVPALQAALQLQLPAWCPGSFSVGECCICTQGITLFFIITSAHILCKLGFLSFGSGLDLEACNGSNFFMQIAVCSALLVALLLYALPWLRHPVLYYVTVKCVGAFFSFPVLYQLLGKNFISWTYAYVSQSKTQIYLFFYWIVCSVVSVMLVVASAIFTQRTFIPADSSKQSFISEPSNVPSSCVKDDDRSENNSRTKNSNGKAGEVSTIQRKQFHVLAMAIFLPGLAFDAEMMCVAATCGAVVFIMLETVRVLRVPPFGEAVHQYLQIFVDKQDQGPVILTHLYLLTGCAVPLWLYPLHTGSHIALYSGLISLGVGDTMASVVGSSIGTHKWTGTSKTVEGTAGAVLSQALFIIILHCTGLCPVISWLKVVLAVLLTSLLEAFTAHIDNLLLPIFMYSILI